MSITTVRDIVTQSNMLSPMDIDLSEIKALSGSIPKDGNIDLNNAEILATKYLRGADMCAELLAISTSHAQKMDALKKKAYSTAALVKSAAIPAIKTDKSRAWFADSDEDYVEACNNHAEAMAFVRWVSSKHDSFVRAHYLCKNIMQRGRDGESAAGWSGAGDYSADNGNNEPEENKFW